MTVQELNTVFGKNVKRYRKQKYRFGRRLAEALGVSEAMTSQYENGHRFPTTKSLVMLAHVLGVEVWQLFYTKEN